MGYTLIKKIME